MENKRTMKRTFKIAIELSFFSQFFIFRLLVFYKFCIILYYNNSTEKNQHLNKLFSHPISNFTTIMQIAPGKPNKPTNILVKMFIPM